MTWPQLAVAWLIIAAIVAPSFISLARDYQIVDRGRSAMNRIAEVVGYIAIVALAAGIIIYALACILTYSHNEKPEQELVVPDLSEMPVEARVQ